MTSLPKVEAAAPGAQGRIAGPAPSVQRQFPLFAVQALNEFPPTAGADTAGEVEAEDNHRYHIKGDAHGKPVRASEWIATHIAEDAHVGAPTPAVIQRIDGTLVFGSRRIAGAADAAVTAQFLTAPTLTNVPTQPSSGLTGVLSSIYAFDMFVHNDDRHFGNYLSIDDNGTRRLYAFDYSRSFFWHWPWSGFPAFNCNTLSHGRLLRKLHGFDEKAAQAVLDRIGTLAPSTVEGFINRMPADWIAPSLRQELVDFWSGGELQKRLQALRDGFGDGSLL